MMERINRVKADYLPELEMGPDDIKRGCLGLVAALVVLVVIGVIVARLRSRRPA